MKSPTIAQFAKMGFGLGLGAMGVHIIFMIVGLALLFWGNLLLIKARRNGTSVYPAYGAMLLGCVFGLGLGASSIMSGMETNF
jgi:hypothetical protein